MVIPPIGLRLKVSYFSQDSVEGLVKSGEFSGSVTASNNLLTADHFEGIVQAGGGSVTASSAVLTADHFEGLYDDAVAATPSTYFTMDGFEGLYDIPTVVAPTITATPDGQISFGGMVAGEIREIRTEEAQISSHAMTAGQVDFG